MIRVFVRLTFAILTLVTIACGSPKRPSGVPEGAVYVPFSKNGGWAECWVDPQANVNRCRIYNGRGERLPPPGREGDDDDVWIRYQGSGVVPEAELEIDPTKTGQVYVWLKNGVILLPRNYFEPTKQLMDEILKARSGGR